MKKSFALLTTLFAVCSSSLMAQNQEKTVEASQAQTVITQTATPQAAVQENGVKADMKINQLNLNTASAAEIQDKLVGIGAKKAQAIVEYREKNGRFISLEQLTEVSGIGKSTLDKNRDRIVIE